MLVARLRTCVWLTDGDAPTGVRRRRILRLGGAGYRRRVGTEGAEYDLLRLEAEGAGGDLLRLLEKEEEEPPPRRRLARRRRLPAAVVDGATHMSPSSL